MHGHGNALAGDKQQTGSQPRKFKLWDVPEAARGQRPAKDARSTGRRDQRSSCPAERGKEKGRDLAHEYTQLGLTILQRKKPDIQAWAARDQMSCKGSGSASSGYTGPAQNRLAGRIRARVMKDLGARPAPAFATNAGLPPTPLPLPATRGRSPTHTTESHSSHQTSMQLGSCTSLETARWLCWSWA